MWTFGGVVAYIYIWYTSPNDLPFLLVSRLWMFIHQFVETGVPFVYIHILLYANCREAHCTALVAGKYAYCTRTMVKPKKLTAQHWLQGSTRTVRVQWSNQETKNQDCTQLLSGILVRQSMWMTSWVSKDTPQTKIHFHRSVQS